MLGWFVCPTVSMVTTSKAGGLEKGLLYCYSCFNLPEVLVFPDHQLVLVVHLVPENENKNKN